MRFDFVELTSLYQGRKHGPVLRAGLVASKEGVKGDSKSGHRAISRRNYHKNFGPAPSQGL